MSLYVCSRSAPSLRIHPAEVREVPTSPPPIEDQWRQRCVANIVLSANIVQWCIFSVPLSS